MKKIALTVLAVFLTLSGVTLAQQTGDDKKDSSMQGMMQQMMKQKQSGEVSMEGTGGMMRMMKMMDQCASMMDSHHADDKPNEGQKK
jgi:hypothetical protein